MRKFVWILLFFSCTPVSEKTVTTKTTVARDVTNMLHNYVHDVANKGLLAEFNYLDNSDTFYWVPPRYTQSINYDSVSAILNKNASRYIFLENQWDDLKVVPLSKTLASYTGTITSTVVLDNTDTVTSHLLESGVVINRGKGWKLLSGQTAIIKN